MDNKDITKLTCDLIKFETIKGNDIAKKKIVDFVKKQFTNKKVYIKEYNINKCPSLVISLKKENNPKIILNGHLDVVPGNKNDFNPKIKNGKIYGRGSGDMKAGCATMIKTIKYFSEKRNRPSLGLMLTTDEETGGANGVGYLTEKKKYRPEIVIIPDGGISLKTIVTHQKGVLHLKIKAHGKSAHSSRPFLGENAVDKLIDSYQKIKRIVPEIKEKEWKTSMNLGKISGGETINRVPHYAEMHLDIRYAKQQDKYSLLKALNKITNYEIIIEGEIFFQEKNHQYIKNYRRIIEEELDEKVEFYKVEGASDARYFSRYNIPTIITKINCGNIHAENEWVDIKEINLFYKSLVKFIENHKT